MQSVVSTLGRALDMIGDLDSRVFVLDEADEMLSRGFKDQTYDILQNFAAQYSGMPILRHNATRYFGFDHQIHDRCGAYPG